MEAVRCEMTLRAASHSLTAHEIDLCCYGFPIYWVTLIILFIVVITWSYLPIFSMKTGLLKWKPDYDGAAFEYGKAGNGSVKIGFPSKCL